MRWSKFFSSSRQFIVFTFLSVACSTTLQAQTAPGDPLVLYTFNEGAGAVVRDVSGNGRPMNLAIRNLANTRWLRGGGLAVDKETIIVSPGSTRKITNAIKASNALTIEAWVQPANTTQRGPARIVTLSADPYNRSFTLGQDRIAYDVRLRSTRTDNNGTPSLATPAGLLSVQLTHIVYTRSTNGIARLYVNGMKQSQKTVAGKLRNWNSNVGFALANELGGGRPWIGKLYRIAIYDRALDVIDINNGFAAGPDAAAAAPTPVSVRANSAPAINSAPTISGTPDKSVIKKNAYLFRPSVSDEDGDKLTFSIKNRPAWASFSKRTGRLKGTPRGKDVGIYSNIVISVSDGNKTVSLPAFKITVYKRAPKTGSVSLNWGAPTTRADGAAIALSEIAGYNLLYVSNETGLISLDINDASALSVTINDLPLGKYHFMLRTIDSNGQYSAYSSTLKKLVQ